jgi:hypothetical protein
MGIILLKSGNHSNLEPFSLEATNIYKVWLYYKWLDIPGHSGT